MVHYERILENEQEKIQEHCSDFAVGLVKLHYGITGNVGLYQNTELK